MTVPPRVLPASRLIGTAVKNLEDENLGKIEQLMIDLKAGRIAYAILSFGGFLGLGDKLFAIPWDAFQLDASDQHFVLHVPKEALKRAPGFEKQQWPDMADRRWGAQIYQY